MLHKSATSSWVKPPSNFIPAPELGRPTGGSSPVIHFFRDQETGARWIGKCGQVPLRDKEVIEAARRLPGFLGVYADEILEKLGLAVYQMLGTEVPESALSYQQVTMEAMHPDMLLAMQLDAEDEGRVFELPHSPRMHYLSRYVEEFQPLDKGFVEHYLANAKRCGNEYVRIATRDGEFLPLRGLGGMLAAADFVYDLDCLGDACGNAGYVIRRDSTGDCYAQLVKIDAGYAFSYSELRTDQTHNPKDRQIRVAPNQLRLQFADLAPADQLEFAATAKRVLAIPYEEFAHLFSQTEKMQDGLSMEHWLELLNGLIARKSLFLKAFAPETDRTIVKEIEAAQAKVAKKFEHTEEVSPQVVEKLLEQEKEEAVALAELRVRLAVVDVKESEPKKVGECKVFQLPSNTTHFVGREEALAQVVKQLNEASGSVIGQSISGIGGVGKTQLALHYAQAAANGERVAGQYLGYEYVVWLNAELFLEGQFQALAEVWTGRKNLKTDEAIEAVYRFFKGKRTLIVFDNAENAQSIAPFLPPNKYASPVHFLITSRSGAWGGLPTIKLEGFSLEEAQEYVEYHLGPQSKESVEKLVELLEGLPLAMSQAVSYIKAGHCTLEGFEKQFYLNQANLLSHELLIEESHPKTIGTTLTLSLAQAKVHSPIVEKLIGFVAYLAPENIKIDLLARMLCCERFIEATAKVESENIPKDLINRIERSIVEEIIQAIGVLENYSLINRDGENIQVHRLVQEVMRHRHKFLSEPQSYWNRVVEFLNVIVFDDDKSIEEMRQCSHAIAHVQQVAKLSEGQKLDEEQELNLGHLLAISGLHQQTMGNYAVARDFQKRALEITERYRGLDHPEVAGTLVNLSSTYGGLGNAIMQKELLERALIIKERHYGPNHPEVAIALNNLGDAYRALGDALKQKELSKRALTIMEAHYGSDSHSTATALLTLGNAYGALGSSLKQKDILERALIILERHYGPTHGEVGLALVSLGNAYGALGDALKQKELVERGFITIEQHYGPDNVQTGMALLNLSVAYFALGNAFKQKELLERALNIFESCFGPDHVRTAEVLANLSAAYGTLGNALKQKEFSERALEIFERHFGSDHPQVGLALINLGHAYGALEDARKQKEVLERALIIEEKHFGLDHPHVATVLINLGNAHGALGDISKQKKFLKRALGIFEKNYGSDHTQIGIVLNDLGVTYGMLGDMCKQKEHLERALNIFKSHYGSNHFQVGRTLGNLGIMYGNLGDASKAKELLECALLIKEQHYGAEHIEMVIVLYNLSRACFKLEKLLEAKNYAQRTCLLVNRYYQKHDEITQKATELLQACERQIKEKIVGGANSGSIKLTSTTLDSGRINEEKRILFSQAVDEWIQELELFFKQQNSFRYERLSAASVISKALKILQERQWEALLEDPEFFGIYREITIQLNAFKEKHPILLEAVDCPDIVEQIRRDLSVKNKAAEKVKELGIKEKEDDVGKTEQGYLQALFLEAVAKWVEAMEGATRVRQPKVYEPDAARTYVSKALMAIEGGYWGQLLESPSRYGIPREFVGLLERYKEDHPILAKGARQSGFVKEVCERLQLESGQEDEKVDKMGEREHSRTEKSKKVFQKPKEQVSSNRSVGNTSNSFRGSNSEQDGRSNLEEGKVGETVGLLSELEAEETSSCTSCIIS